MSTFIDPPGYRAAPGDPRQVDYVEALAREVFRRNPALRDGRDLHNRGGTLGHGALGAPVLMLRECPSERSVRAGGSQADLLLAEALTASRLRRSPDPEHGDARWLTYVTNVVKSTTRVGDEWKLLTPAEQAAIAEQWAPVLAAEIDYCDPEVVIVFGDRARKLFEHVVVAGLIAPVYAPSIQVTHYSSTNYKPTSRPEVRAEYLQRFGFARDLALAAASVRGEAAA